VTDYFPTDSIAARTAFRTAADRLGWPRVEVPLTARGPASEVLTLDVAVSSAAGLEPTLFLSGGVHGVEAPVGSAVQLAVLDRIARTGPVAGVRYLMLHVVNPYGYTHGRRFDVGNVDLNRNFLDPGESYSGSPPLYRELDPHLNPPRPPAWWDPFTLRSLLLIARYGLPRLKQAIAGGQFDFPKGIFYGGSGPAEVHRILADRLAGWLANTREVCQLDFHTGLGRWGTYKLLLDPPIPAGVAALAAHWFGADVVEASEPEGVAYQTRGSFGPWCARRGGGRPFLTLTAEFGTYNNISVLGAIRAENQAHHWARPASRSFERAKARLREVFCPASPEWRNRVLSQSLDLIRRAESMLVRSG
jgi:hypothetical protein